MKGIRLRLIPNMKLCGLLFLFLAGTTAGFYQEQRLKQHYLLLMDMLELMRTLKSEICYLKIPFPEMIHQLQAEQDTKPMKCFLEYIESNLKQTNPEELYPVWKEGTERLNHSGLFFVQEEKTWLMFGKQLTNRDLKGQETALAFLEQQMEKSLKQAEEVWSIQGKLYQKLGIAVGLLLVLLLW